MDNRRREEGKIRMSWLWKTRDIEFINSSDLSDKTKREKEWVM